MSDSQHDKRTLERRKVHWRAIVLLPNGQQQAAQIINASEEGLGLRCAMPIGMGSEVALMLAVADRQHPGKTLPVRLQAKVMFELLSGSEFMTGLNITQISDQDRECLRVNSRAH